MGIGERYFRIKSRFEATIEKRERTCEGQMSLKRELFLWKTFSPALPRWSGGAKPGGTKPGGAKSGGASSPIRSQMLAGCNINRFGQAEGEPAPFFKRNDGGRGFARLRVTLWSGAVGTATLRTRTLWTSVLLTLCLGSGDLGRRPAHEKAGGLNRQANASELDRVEGQPEVSAIASEVGGLGRLHSTCNRGTARN